jgi:hypothetical protein
MSSFSCLKEYFLPEVSSFGRLTGQTEMTGIAASISNGLYEKWEVTYFGILAMVRTAQGRYERPLSLN